ncbi:hypothetical protein SmJEL517_g05616 [Synchytrium microbalum]|uniref:Uncharacterized protein n=1 Tax=Synchytrium microbalum TaxID=1806994 RepID=A0A507BMZ9_9FUNG|nr:uncharacterized protein SmJEL517_g05616 [Synchytrium microbalum]TPX30927.1 hypothetical protein SmJEL517_g05616 [Synchytrium microbalum]
MQSSIPLYTIPDLHTSAYGSVQVYIHDSLIPTAALRKKQNLDLLVLLSKLEMILTRQGYLNYDQDEVQAAATIDELSRLALQHNFRLLDFLVQEQLVNVFPKSARRLGLPENTAERVDIRNYLYQVNQLNQMVAMALQLHVDVNLQNHKYIAHQLALLYQCLNLVGEPFNKFQANIQQEFDSIKAITSSATDDAPQLSEHQKQWLSSLTSEIVNAALYTNRRSILPKPVETLLS